VITIKKISAKEKCDIKGGFGPMAAWVTIMGITLGVQTLMSVVSTFTSNNEQQTQKSSYSSSKQKSMYIRMSPFPARTTINS
jgi:hypothetical protein